MADMEQQGYADEQLACLRCGKRADRDVAQARKFQCKCGGWLMSRTGARARMKNRRFMAGVKERPAQ